MASVTAIMEQHDKEQEEKKKLTAKEKREMKKLQKKLEKEAKIRRSQEQQMEIDAGLANKNIIAYRRKWKEIQMEKGRPEYNEYMMEHWCLFDHMMDNKDKLIEVYHEELLHAERTRKRTYMDHVLTTNNLFKEFYKTLENLKVEMKERKDKMLAKHEMRTKLFKEKSAWTEENMRLVLYLIEQKRIEDFNLMEAEFLFQRDEETSKNRSENELLVAKIQAKMKILWKEYKNFLENYTAYTEKILKRSEPLLVKVSLDDQIILEQKNKLKRMKNLFEIAKYRSEKEPMAVQLRDLRAERTDLYEMYIKQKKEQEKRQKEKMARIGDLLKTVTNVHKTLKSIIQRGENILKIKKLCMRLETKTEQDTQVKDEINYQRIQHQIYNKTAKFMKRVARAEMTQKVIAVQCRAMKKENRDLRHKMGSLIRSPQMKHILKDITRCSQQFI